MADRGGPVLGMCIGQFDDGPPDPTYAELPDTYGMWDGDRTHLARGLVLPPRLEGSALVTRTRVDDVTLCGRPTRDMVLPTHLNGYGGQPLGAPWCRPCAEVAFGPGFVALNAAGLPEGVEFRG